jgi:Uma2 family endonuclease
MVAPELAQPSPEPWAQVPVLEPHHFLTEPMESEHHLIAMLLLHELVTEVFGGREDVYIGADMVVYFSDLQVRNKDFRAPDLTVVTDVEPKERQGWIVWLEDGRYPDLVVEHMSPSTRETDLGKKLRIYGHIWKVREYWAFDLETGELHAFAQGPDGLVRREADASGRWRSTVLGVNFYVDPKGYRNMRKPVLRLCDAAGVPVPTGAERAAAQALVLESEKQRAESEKQRAESEKQRADALEAEVRALKARLGLT